MEFTNAFCDENANIIKPPFDIELPKEILYRIIFTEKNGKTTITLTGQPVNASRNDQEIFNSINADVQKGFNATFNQLERYLATIQNSK